MSAQKLLLPYNFTQQDQKTLNFVVDTFGRLEEVKVTIFHTYSPPPDIEVSSSSVTAKLRENIGYLKKKIGDQEEALKQIKHRLVAAGFPEENVNLLFKPRKRDIANEILELCANENFNMVVLNHRAGRVSRFFGGSVYNKVVENVKDTAVCIVS